MKTEEDVKIKYLIPLLEEKGYLTSHCDFEVSIEVQEGRRVKNIFADVVVYADKKKTSPLILVETKSPSEPLTKSVRDQAISYARLLPKIAPICLITNGIQSQVFQTLTKDRIEKLPEKSELRADIISYAISKETQAALRTEAKHELFIIDDVSTFKSILKACHNEIRNNEGYDPTDAFDEMSKLLFCKMHEERRGGRNRFRVQVFDDTLESIGINVVKQIFAETKSDPAYAGLFDSEAEIRLQDRSIRKIVSLFENVDLSLTAFDVKGEAFEYFLSDTFTGGLGEYFTPRNVVEFISEAIDPRIGEKIIDPFCGTGGFLMYAFELVSEKIRIQDFSEDEKSRWKSDLSERCLFGTDWKERTAQACKMNMVVHGDGSSGIYLHHGLIDVPNAIEPGLFDVCLTNPPFGSFENDPNVLKKYELARGRTSQDRLILGIERCMELLRPGGRMGIVVIDGILNNARMGYVREYIRQHAWVRGVVSLNRETFEGYNARAKTSILFLEKKAQKDEGQQSDVFFAVAKNTGYAANGGAVAGNELPDILLDYKEFRAGRAPTLHKHTAVCAVQDRLDAEFYLGNLGKAHNADFFADVTCLNDELAELEKKVKEVSARIGEDFASCIMNVCKIGDLVEQVWEKESVQSDVDYSSLGVKWWGGGTFVREVRKGASVKAASLYKVTAGDIIYNRLFAYRGSFAVVSKEHDGFFVSNEFPTFRVKEGCGDSELLAEYIVTYLNSPPALSEVDRLSTGSTKQSRNRFYEKLFIDLDIQVPASPTDLEGIVEGIRATKEALRAQEDFIEKLKKTKEKVETSLSIGMFR